MNTYYTTEEKYLHAINKLIYGRTPKALQLFNEIVNNDPLYARAHHQLGKIYYYEIQDYQTAGYHFKTCMELEPCFPDNYFHYLHLVVFLNMDKQAGSIAAKAIATPGVNNSLIYELLALSQEKAKDWTKALNTYHKALNEATSRTLKEKIEGSIERIEDKIRRSKPHLYYLSG